MTKKKISQNTLAQIAKKRSLVEQLLNEIKAAEERCSRNSRPATPSHRAC